MDALEIAIEVIGWAAAVLILAAYALLSFGKLEARGRIYQGMNVLGAAGFIVNSGYHGALPNAALNIVWVAVGLATLWSVRRERGTTIAGQAENGGR